MDADQWGSGIAAIEQEGEEDGLKHHNVQLELIGWEGTDGLPTPQTQQPTAESNQGESIEFLLRAAEERAANTQQSAEREGLMWMHYYVVMLLYT
jgi:hypothetical protein